MRLIVCALLLVSATYAQTPQRIISTSPSITETLFALGLGDRVVAVTEYCKYPPEAARLPKIGSWTTVNLEAVAAARPDLIVVQKTAVHGASRFQALRVRTVEVSFDRIRDIYDTIHHLGAVAGVESRARQLRESIQGDLEQVRHRVSARQRTSVMFVVGRQPGSLDGIVAVGGGSYLDEVIEVAGGRNILADSALAFPKVLHEEIIARSPEVILDMGEHADAATLSEQQRKAEVALWKRFPTVNAVRTGRVHPVSSAVYVVPGPRVVQCAREFAKFLHPELFP